MTIPEQSDARLEVNSVRLRTTLELASREVEAGDYQLALSGLGESDQELIRTLDENDWISAEAEGRILSTALPALGSSLSLVRTAGEECISGLLQQVLSHLPGGKRVENYLNWIPSFAVLFNQGLAIARAGSRERNYRFTLERRDGGIVSAVDVLFTLGLIEGLLEYISVGRTSVRILELALAEAAWPTGVDREGATLDSANSWLEVNVPDLRRLVSEVARKAPRLNWSTSPREAFVRQVIARSAQLFHDKRELSTAVEYLNMANEELEKEIRANDKELRMAANIQKGFIPAAIPDWEGLQFWVHWQPMSQVSGDLFDYMPLPGERLGLLVCDVSGHGVPAALISAIARISLQTDKGGVPSEIFSQVNMEILNHVKMEGYLTAFLMNVDAEYRAIYSTAGFPPPLLWRARTQAVERLEGTGTLLGMFSDAGDLFSDYRLELEPGDKLFLYTDGMSEAVDPSEEQFGEARLTEAVAETAGLEIRESCEHIVSRHREFTLGTSQQDDLTLVGVMVSARLDEFRSIMARAQTQYRAGQVAAASATMELARQIFPRSPRVLYLLCKYMAMEKRYDEALELLKTYHTFRPYDANSHTIQAYCLFRLGHTEQAEQKLKQSLNLRSDNPSAMLNLARVYQVMGNLGAAETLMQVLREMGVDPEILDSL